MDSQITLRWIHWNDWGKKQKNITKAYYNFIASGQPLYYNYVTLLPVRFILKGNLTYEASSGELTAVAK